MSPENRGQYYFSAEKNVFKIKKKPLGHVSTPNSLERIKSIVKPRKKQRQLPNIDQIRHVGGEVSHSEDAFLIHDILMEDLKAKGILEILARETQTDPLSWFDWAHDDPDGPKRLNPSVWDITIDMPKYNSMPDPSSPSCWAIGAKRRFHWWSNELSMVASKGPLGEESSVFLHYNPQQVLTIEGKSSSTLDLTNPEQLAFVKPFIKDALENPLQSVPSYADGRVLDII